MGYCTQCQNFQRFAEPVRSLDDHFGVEREGVCIASYDGQRVLLTGSAFGFGCEDFLASPALKDTE